MRRLTKSDSLPVSVSEISDGASTFGYFPPSPVLYCDPNTTTRLPLLRSPVNNSSYASTSLFASHTTRVAGDLALSALWQKSEISDVCGILSMAYRTAAAFRSRTFATILASATDLPVPDCPSTIIGEFSLEWSAIASSTMRAKSRSKSRSMANPLRTPSTSRRCPPSIP